MISLKSNGRICNSLKKLPCSENPVKMYQKCTICQHFSTCKISEREYSMKLSYIEGDYFHDLFPG